MAGSWATARAAIKAAIDGAAITSPHAEPLVAYEYPPAGRQGAESFPYAFILPPARHVERWPGGQRVTQVTEAVVVVMLAPPDGGPDRELLAKRHDAWVDALADVFDSEIALGGTADVVLGQDFGPEQPFEFEGGRWGFEMRLAVDISESKTFAA